MKPAVLLGITIIAAILWLIQWTPYAFMTEGERSFTGGFTVGAGIGVAISWWATRAGTTTRS